MRHRPLTVSEANASVLLRTELRRQVVTFLLETDRSWCLNDLAAELVRLDAAAPPEHVDGETYVEQITTKLHHNAIPRLADAGVLTYRRETQAVTPGPRLSALGSQLDSMLGLRSVPDDAGASTGQS